MALTKKEIKRTRKIKKTNLKNGRKTYRLKRKKATITLRHEAGRRSLIFRHLKQTSPKTQEALQTARAEYEEVKQTENKNFNETLASASPYDLRYQEIKKHRLPQANLRHKTARSHLKTIKEEEKREKQEKVATEQSKESRSRFFYSSKSLERLQAEREVSQSKQELNAVLRAKKEKSPRTKLKRLSRFLGRENLYLASQDEDLSGARDIVETGQQVYRYGRLGVETGKATIKATKVTSRFMTKRVNHMKERFRNVQSGKGWILNHKRNHVLNRFKRQAARKAHQTKQTGKALQAVISSIKKFFSSLVANPITWLVSGILCFLFLMIAFFLGYASQSLIQQDEFELTKAYTHMTWEDAEHTRTNPKGITYYTKIDDVMAYMNVQFQDYSLEDTLGGGLSSSSSETYRDYLSTLWEDLNGGSSLKAMLDLYDTVPYVLSSEERDELKELSEEGVYASLQELENPFKGKSEQDELPMSYRYGYYYLDGRPTLQPFIVLEASIDQVIVSPLDGIIHIEGGDVIIQAGTKESAVSLRLYGIHTGRLVEGQSVVAGDILGQTKDGSGLKVSYEKYDLDEKALVPVNPAFYFPNVVQVQTTILPTIGQFGGDEFERAKAIYTYLKAKGVTDQAIAAILGNWSVESSINPKRAEGDYLSPPVGASDHSWGDPNWLSIGGPAIYNGGYPNILHRGLGLGQWTDTADGSRRHTLLLEYAKLKGKAWYELDLQLDFMLHGDSPYYTNWLSEFFKNTGSPASLAQVFLTYWEGNSGDKLIERQSRATEWYYQIEKGFSQPNGGTAKSDPAALEAVKQDLFDNSIPGGGDGMGYAYGQCTWGVAARINQLGLKLKGRNGEEIPITSVMGNGQDWVRSAATLGGETGSVPRAGAIISFAGGSHGTWPEYGHVSFVEKVYPDGSFLVSETNVNGNPNYTFRKISGSDAAMSFAYTVK